MSIHITGHRHHFWHPAVKPTQAERRVGSDVRNAFKCPTVLKNSQQGQSWLLIFLCLINIWIKNEHSDTVKPGLDNTEILAGYLTCFKSYGERLSRKPKQKQMCPFF